MKAMQTIGGHVFVVEDVNPGTVQHRVLITHGSSGRTRTYKVTKAVNPTRIDRWVQRFYERITSEIAA